MNNHTYLAGTLPSSSLNTATTTSINPQLPPTTDNTFQFMPQSTTDQFTRISPATSLSKGPGMYQSQQHMGFSSENSSKNMVPAFPISQHITTGAHNQHTWDMIQQHYDLRLAESIGTPSSSSSPLSSAVKQLNSPTSLGIPSATSTPPLYQELIGLSTSSPTSTQAVDTSQQTSRLQHPAQSQMVTRDMGNRTESTQSSPHEPIYWEQGNSTLDAFGDPNNNEQRLLQQQNSDPKPTEHQDQIIRQSRQLHEYSLPVSGSNLPSSSFMPSDQQGNQNSTSPPKQQKLAPSSASSNYHKTPNQQIRSDTSNSKRSHQDSSATTSKESDTPQTKKPKNDTAAIQQASQQPKIPTPAPESASAILPPKPLPFTVASFDHMTREEMVERLVFLENERLDLQQQLEQRKPQSAKHPKTNNNNNNNSNNNSNNNNSSTVSNNEIPTEDTLGKPNSKTGGGDDDDDDDDEVESISSGAEINPTSDDKTEMKCLWKNCGTIRVGVRDLTDHIVSAHVGGGKPLYRCEWENCRRSHKPFTKRHKICNHLRVHTGERPFVCDKPGKKMKGR
ncbi:hypothetical protein BCR42DRAFT_8134 [Absidia repens]|uniref:C2H2-type domain-containing protein n=1 Tax=Absidia repens TaxID=90262 RepID=A0A1X2J103_9FUNG|nr:hypothetical protein BCR42DRAFT_8134 [Absidia repens]